MIHLPRPWFIIAMLHSYVIQPVSLISSLLGKHFDLMVFVPVELMFLPRTGCWKHLLSCWWRCLSGFYFEKCVASSRDFTWASLKQTRCKHTLFTAHTVGSLWFLLVFPKESHIQEEFRDQDGLYHAEEDKRSKKHYRGDFLWTWVSITQTEKWRQLIYNSLN